MKPGSAGRLWAPDLRELEELFDVTFRHHIGDLDQEHSTDKGSSMVVSDEETALQCGRPTACCCQEPEIDSLTEAGLYRLEEVLDDADFEVVPAPWAVKQRLRAMLAAKDISAVQNARIDF